MALISFGYRVDMFAIDPPLEVGSYIVAYDLDGALKQKDHLGVVTLVGSGAGGPQGPPGPVGPAGLTWSGYWVATQSYSENYAVGYGSASWWCISAVTGSPSNPGPDLDTTHWTLLAAQGSPGSQGGTGSQGLQGPQGPIGINWIGDWIINVYDVRDAVYYNGSSYVCIASTVGTETLSPDTNTACWDIISLKGDVGPQGATGSPGVSGATGSPGVSGATGSTLQDIFYNIGGTVSATNSTTAIYRTGSVGIGLTATSGLSASLHIKGTSSVSGNSLLVENSSNTQLLKVLNNGQIILGDSNSAAAPASSVQGVFIIGPGNSNYGFNTSNPNLLTFIVGSTDPTFVSGIQGASANHGNVRSGIYFTNNASDIVFRTGPTATLPERMRINVSGNVGIGTASPSTTLHVYATQSGAFRLEDGSQGNNYILKSDSNGVATWTPLSSIGISGASGSIPKFTGTSSLGDSRFYEIGTAGYYGSGSSYVSFLTGGNTWLTLNRSQSSMGFILGNPQSPTFQLGQIQSTNTIGLSVESAGYTSFNTGVTYTEKMRITSTGNVGIGLTGPSTKLHVFATQSGAFRLEDGTQGNNYILTSDSNGVGSWTNSNIYWIKDVNTIYNSNTGAIVLFGNTASSPLTGLTSSPVLIIQGNNYTTYGGNNQNPAIITFMATQNNNYPSDNVVTGIQSSDYNYGNVRAGIYFQSEVSNAGRPSIVFRTGSSLTEIMRISQAGNIGIGTASPSTKLHIYATQSGALRLEDGTQGNGYILTSDANGVATWTASIYATDSNVVHKTGDESISGIKTFTNTGFLTSVVVQNYNTNPSSSALESINGNGGMGIKSENTSSGIGIYSNSTSTGLNYVGANSGVTTFSVNKTGAVSIGTGTASNSRFLVSSSGGTNSLYVNEAGDSVFRGDTKIIGATLSSNSSIPAGSITFGNKTSIYSPGDRQIVIGTDNLSGYNYQYGWKFTDYQITNQWGNPIEVQNTIGTIGNLFVGSNFAIAGYGGASQQSTLFVKGTTASIMRVVGIGATWSNSQSIFEINNSGAVSIGTSQSMSDSKLFIQSSTSSTTIGSNVMLDLYNGDTGTFDSISEIAFSQNGQPGASQPYNVGHRYALITGYAITGNNSTSIGGIKFSTRATTGVSLVTSLVVDQNGSVYNDARGSNTLYGFNALLVSTGINNTAIGSSVLQNNLGGLNNTAVGILSMASNTSGSYNTAVGSQALVLNVLGNDNTAIGISSQYSATQSSGNTSVGRESLYNNLSSGLVAIGTSTLTNNTIGVGNAAFGYQSLFSNTTVVLTINITNGGSGYTMSSTFSNVQLSYISGSTAFTYPIVTVYVGTGGTVSTVTLVTNGSGFKDTTTVMGANLGTGVTFSVSVGTLNSGDYNTAVGYRSLYSNTTGDNNVAVGYRSLYSNTIGDNNVALGYQALYSNTTGSRNTALGHSSLYSNTTGIYNTALGSRTLLNNIIGSFNIALGEDALFNNYNGDYNIAISPYALASNISGTNNIAIGVSALVTATQSSNNIAIGYETLYLNTSTQNIGIGMRSLRENTTGGNNTALGYYSLYSNTTGANNTALGYYAGTLVSGTTSGATNSNNSLFIGYDTRPQADGQTNQIVIGYGATGNGSNSVTLGNNSITRTYLKGSVVIADGTQGNGYILTSDTNGVASWTASFALGVIATSSNITTDTLDINGLNQRGRCVIIDNGTYSINLTVNGATGFSSTYLKHGTASVTFVQGSGRTLVQVDGTAVLNGIAGSTATLLSYGTTDYLRINNA